MPAPRCLAHAAMIFVTATFSLWNVLGDVVLKLGPRSSGVHYLNARAEKVNWNRSWSD